MYMHERSIVFAHVPTNVYILHVKSAVRGDVSVFHVDLGLPGVLI